MGDLPLVFGGDIPLGPSSFSLSSFASFIIRAILSSCVHGSSKHAGIMCINTNISTSTLIVLSHNDRKVDAVIVDTVTQKIYESNYYELLRNNMDFLCRLHSCYKSRLWLHGKKFGSGRYKQAGINEINQCTHRFYIVAFGK